MNEPLSINQALDALEALSGRDVVLCGTLRYAFEELSINHYPSSEQKDGYASSVWISDGEDDDECGAPDWEKFDGELVVLRGTLIAGRPGIGRGHLGLWPAEIRVKEMERQ